MAIVWLVSCIFRLFQCKRASWRNNLRLLANQNTWFSSLVPLRLRQGRRTDSTKRSTLPSFLPFTFLRGFFRLAVPSLPHYRHSSAADCRSVAARSFRGLRLLHLEPRKFCGVRKPFVRDLTQPISPRRARGMRPRRGDFFLLPSLRRGRPSLHLHVLAQQGRVSPLSCLDRPTDRARATTRSLSAFHICHQNLYVVGCIGSSGSVRKGERMRLVALGRTPLCCLSRWANEWIV